MGIDGKDWSEEDEQKDDEEEDDEEEDDEGDGDFDLDFVREAIFVFTRFRYCLGNIFR